MADLYSTGMAPDEAAGWLRAFMGSVGCPQEVHEALRVVLEDRERLAGVAACALDVREAQRRYFRDRTNESLTASKELERKLDAMLKDRDG